MSWIRTIADDEASGKLRRLYDRIRGPQGTIDNVLRVHGLRPHTLEGHMALYKGVLHHRANRLPRWLLETVGIRVSLLNGCDYCVRHHLRGLRRLLDDDARADRIEAALRNDRLDDAFEPRERRILEYATLLSRAPDRVDATILEELRDVGLTDGEILEVNQVAAYFAYVNRTVLGLGVTTEGDVLGLSPSDGDDPDSWEHR